LEEGRAAAQPADPDRRLAEATGEGYVCMCAGVCLSWRVGETLALALGMWPERFAHAVQEQPYLWGCGLSVSRTLCRRRLQCAGEGGWPAPAWPGPAGRRCRTPAAGAAAGLDGRAAWARVLPGLARPLCWTPAAGTAGRQRWPPAAGCWPLRRAGGRGGGIGARWRQRRLAGGGGGGWARAPPQANAAGRSASY
jgi:hypothetical protein